MSKVTRADLQVRPLSMKQVRKKEKKMLLLQIDMKKTGAKIKKLCREKDITVRDIQNELGIGAFQSVYDWFSGKSLPSLDNFFYLSKLLGVHMEDMIEEVRPAAIDFCWTEKNNSRKTHLIMYFNRLLQYMSIIQLQTE